MRYLSVVLSLFAVMTAMAAAAPVTVTPKVLTLQIGGRVFGRVVASAATAYLAVGKSTCFNGTAPSARDILKVTGMSHGAKTSNESSYALDVRAQHAGRCIITFVSEGHSTSVDVIVEAEAP